MPLTVLLSIYYRRTRFTVITPNTHFREANRAKLTLEHAFSPPSPGHPCIGADLHIVTSNVVFNIRSCTYVLHGHVQTQSETVPGDCLRHARYISPPRYCATPE